VAAEIRLAERQARTQETAEETPQARTVLLIAGAAGAAAEMETTAGTGKSGEVVIRYLTADAAGFTITTTGSPTTGTDGSYTYYQYTATGTLVIA
jgi:hypothetical protein